MGSSGWPAFLGLSCLLLRRSCLATLSLMTGLASEAEGQRSDCTVMTSFPTLTSRRSSTKPGDDEFAGLCCFLLPHSHTVCYVSNLCPSCVLFFFLFYSSTPAVFSKGDGGNIPLSESSAKARERSPHRYLLLGNQALFG